MATRRNRPAGALILLVPLIAGCAHHHRSRPEEPPAPGPSAPAQPETINSGLAPGEALWHVRAALNVAALLCGRHPGGAALVQRYNALLVDDKAALAVAYASETRRYGSGDPAALDRHMTQLYNFFARPQATPALCAVAAEESQQASSTPATQLTAFAPRALMRLQSAILAPPPLVPPRIASTVRRPASPDAGSGEWRIQLGAFTGRPAALAAWAKVRTRLPSLAAYQPHYEAVPDSPLVRLQIGSAHGRDDALRLCAAAATGGFDCMTVPKSRSWP
ncbi:MAG TPA: SPOR domain-containing protein [Sphingomonas sp.]